MADINIEKKGNPMWPWLVGLIVLAVVAFVVMQYLKGRNSSDASAPPVDSSAVQTSTQ